MNRNYQRGRQAEYKMMKILENLKYQVFRCAGSHSPIDLIAVKPMMGEAVDLQPEVRFIQMKASHNTKNIKCIDKIINHLKVEFWKFPIKDDKWNKKYSKKAKKAKKLRKKP